MLALDDISAAAALAEAARTMGEAPDLDAVLDTIARSAAASVPGMNHAGITTIGASGRYSTLAATGEIVHVLDELQYEASQGPCLDAVSDFRLVAASDLPREERWPGFIPRAIETVGLRSQIAVHLFVEKQHLRAGLNLYSTEHDRLLPGAVEMAELFAVHASLALGHAREITQLSEAVESRTTIGQAVGILMQRYTMNRDRAFAFLVRASSHSNIKVRDIATEVIEEAERAARRESGMD